MAKLKNTVIPKELRYLRENSYKEMKDQMIRETLEYAKNNNIHHSVIKGALEYAKNNNIDHNYVIKDEKLYKPFEKKKYDCLMEVPCEAVKFTQIKTGLIKLDVICPELSGEKDVKESILYDLNKEIPATKWAQFKERANVTDADMGNDISFKGILSIQVLPSKKNPDETIAFRNFKCPKHVRK